MDTAGIEHVGGKSFHWTGSYNRTLNEADTLATELNVFETFAPKIPKSYLDSEFLFLANIDPKLQARVRQQMPKVRMVCGDTMNYWIKDHRAALGEVLVDLDVLLINDGEAKMLAEDANLVRAAKKVLAMGVKTLIVKHGEYGATVFFSERSFPGAKPETYATPFRAPALPLAEVVDPDRCGRFVCRRVLWLSGIAEGRADTGEFSQGDVLWRRDGLVCGGEDSAPSARRS